MFFLLKRKSNQKDKQNTQHNETAQSIVYRCLRRQVQASQFLQKKSEMLTVKAKRLVVIAFCFMSFCSCLYIIIESVCAHPDTSLAISTIRAPTQNVHINMVSSISKEEFQRIENFKSYLDSLAKTNAGKRILDSIIANRPGLIDSLSIVENLYQTQTTNK
jgi:hypothetical protein